MTAQNDKEKTWDVLVTMDATISANLRVTANTHDEAGDKALDQNFIISNAHRFQLDSDNLGSWANDAYLPDPDDGIQLIQDSDTADTFELSEYSEYQKKLLDVCSSAYEPEEEDRPDLSAPLSLGVNTSDGLASFLSREFRDVIKGESDEKSAIELIRSVNLARRQLLDIVEALEEFIY